MRLTEAQRSQLQIFLEGYPITTPEGDTTHILSVPLVRQAASHTCGPAALLSVLYYWGVSDGAESDLYEPLNTTEEQGTAPTNMLKYGKALGLRAELQKDLTQQDLEDHLQAGDTCILPIQAWGEKPRQPWKQSWSNGHYVVLVGIDSKNLYFMDPSVAGGYSFIPRAEFDDRWHDYRSDVEYVHAALVFRGKKALPTIPGPLQRTESHEDDVDPEELRRHRQGAYDGNSYLRSQLSSLALRHHLNFEKVVYQYVAFVDGDALFRSPRDIHADFEDFAAQLKTFLDEFQDSEETQSVHTKEYFKGHSHIRPWKWELKWEPQAKALITPPAVGDEEDED